jgi:glycosyltransferase involved in cell wall biosynthesis
MKKIVRVAFIGARGIPAKYGGAETFVEEISQKLTQRGFEVYVTCNSHRFHKDEYNGVIRLHAPSIEGKTFTVPTVNEILATIHLLIRCPKVELVYYLLSYGTLVAIIPRLLRKKVIVNADGIEWKRPPKRQPYLSLSWKLLAVLASWYLRLTERLAVKLSDVVIADSRAIKAYLEERYEAKNVAYISYGARELLHSAIPPKEEHEVLQGFGLSTGGYYLTVARIVPENNIHIEIEGFKRSKSDKKLVIIGNFNEKDRYTKYLFKLSNNNKKIVLLSAIFDKKLLGIIRKSCYAYIHAYEFGGTNPSLLEQMSFGRPILANDVPFHREILQGGGVYFSNEEGLASAIVMLEKGEADLKEIAEWQARRLEEEYNWDYVAEKYVALFRALLAKQ